MCVRMQNPPAVPTLPVAWFASVVHRCPLMIDWHNLGFTMLCMAMRDDRSAPRKLLPRLCLALEKWCARRAALHVCVTKAMGAYLCTHFGVSAHTLYDCPPHMFTRDVSVDDKHNLFMRLYAA